MHQSTRANPHSWWIRNPGRFFSLQLTNTVAVEAGIRCFISLEDEMLVATQKNASIVNYSWKDKVLLGSLSLAQDAASFMNPADVMVNQMVYDPIQAVFGWLTTDGSVYIVKRKISLEAFASGTPYEWQGAPCHSCDGTPETYAFMISINPQHYLVAAVMRSNIIVVYSYGKSGLVGRKSHTISVGSQVTCLSWSDNGMSLAVGTASKGLMVFGVYDTVADVTTSSAYFACELEQNDDPYTQRVHCLSWCSEDLEILAVSSLPDHQKGKFYSLPFSRVASSTQLTSDNALFPTLFSSSKVIMDFFVQTKHGSINPNAMTHSAQIPHTYELDNSPIKYVSRSRDGQFLAVAGRRGLAHYSLLSQKWKLFNNHNQEQSIRCIGGMVWYKNTLIVGCKVVGVAWYQIKFFPREKNLDLLYALCTLDIQSYPVYLNMIDNWLLVYTADNLLTFFDVASDINGRITSVNVVQKISLEGVVKSPQTVRAVAWFPEDLRSCFPKMMVLMGGALLLFTPDTTDAASTPRYKITQIAEKISHFQVLNTSLAGLHFSLWAYCQGKINIWYQLSHLADPQVQTFNIPFHPLTLDIKQGLAFGVEQSAHDSSLIPGIYFTPSFKSHIIFHQILDHLVTHALDQEAYLFSINYEPYPYFGYGLEILLHDILVRAPEDLPKATNLIRQFPHFPEVVVSCARKIEVALWEQLFEIVGSPYLLFEQCLASRRFEAASSCLIILHTLEPAHVSASASAELLRCAVKDQNMALFHNVARFVARIEDSPDLDFLASHLKGLVMNTKEPGSSAEAEPDNEPSDSPQTTPQS
ncbi:WD40 repeat protein [Entomophthora muscae]|uniref:WD40 repeat protein n=1 Tax=Entomophthora muscae TaxID=34485 RepID=A0ACC2RW90_9FUNG|nr:WD40 repeat protein [Entomophthora muscae]